MIIGHFQTQMRSIKAEKSEQKPELMRLNAVTRMFLKVEDGGAEWVMFIFSAQLKFTYMWYKNLNVSEPVMSPEPGARIEVYICLAVRA